MLIEFPTLMRYVFGLCTILLFCPCFSSLSCSNCQSGTYFNSATSLCVSCQPGYQCGGGCSDPVPCGYGEFQSEFGSSTCNNCAVGYYSGQKGSVTCTLCPPGFSCSNSTISSPTICSEGTFSISGQTSCTPCYAGTWSSTPGSSSCSPCPAGSYCPHGAIVSKLCDAGYYAPEKSASCTYCPPGYYCPTVGTAAPYLCHAGTYSVGGQFQCTSCPAGYSCPSTTNSLQQRCVSGSFSLTGQGNCTLCPSGKQCSSDGTTFTSCSPGSYSILGDSSCHSCLPGFYCPDTSLALQIPCDPGSFSSAGQTQCTTCPPGHYCPSTSCTGATKNCSLPCNDGSFSVGGQTSCTLCSAGYACPSTTTSVSIPCSVGEYSLAGQSSCNICPAGYFCPSRSSEPLICAAGTFSSVGQTSCSLALPGYRVPYAGSVNQTICDAGYYSSGGAAQCTPCNPGYLCLPGSTEASPPSSACPIGGYCAVATTFTPCPVGYYGVITGGVSAEQACSPCDAGYYCNTVGGTKLDRQLCPPGAYCPVNSASPIYCAAGFLSTGSGQISISSCLPCTRGFYCLTAGSVEGVACPVGYYCPEGTIDYSVYPCPEGTYSDSNGLSSASQCTTCPSGHFCPAGSNAPSPCKPGTYNIYSGASSNSSCIPCEAGYACPASSMSALTISCSPGYYCPQGSTDPARYSCPAGKYSDAINLVSQSSCTSCPAGFTCAIHSTTSTMEKCRAGYYCPEGTAWGGDVPCPAGTYSSETQLSSASECTTCTPGYYCTGGNTTTDGKCGPGYYCPSGTPSRTYYPCPAGTYSDGSGEASSLDACNPCEPGHYCLQGSAVMLPCPNGTYSSNYGTLSATNCSPCPAGYHCLAGESEPKPCGPGRYSEAASAECIVCPLGRYCASNTTTATMLATGGNSWDNSEDLAGVCFNGTYCPVGVSIVPNLLSNPCPAGYYCPAGTLYPMPCPAGKYSKVTGRFELADCLPSPSGHYSINGSHEPTGLCNPGYYCPLESTSPNQVPCPSRTYLPDYGGETVEQCSPCTAGGYCPNEGNAIPVVCPKGYYCVTGLDEPLPCPPGTYSNSTGLVSADECRPCDGGMYCDGYALTSPRGLSYEGFYCIAGCNTSTPTYEYANLIGGYCTAGHYCKVGTTLPTPCPPGTFNPLNGSKYLSDCVPCSTGMYCEGYGNSKPTGYCKKGYYCSGGAYAPTQHEVLPGYYSLSGATNMTACSPGFYNDKYLQSNCTPCQSGYFCPDSGMSTFTTYLCTPGHYCPTGTAIPIRCPVGTFSPLSVYGNYDVSNCTDCTSGSYCATAGLTAVTGPCDAGFYCTLKASSKMQTSYSATGGPCTRGHYCLSGSDSPTPCPRGTYMADAQNNGNRTVRGVNYFCDLCLSGKSCNNLGLLSYDGGIAQGYWAAEGAPSVMPLCDNAACADMYGVCPIGSYCPTNSTRPIPCGEGYYQDEEGQASCKVCPIGYFCSRTATFLCPPGSYCPRGTHTQFLCPNGTFGASEGLQNITQCTPCTAGYYCATAGLSAPTGLCEEGYFCGGSSTLATPFGGGHIGGYAVTYTGDSCVHAVNYTINDICPPGHYCPRGSKAPIMCLPGTNASAVGLHNISSCAPCPPGYYCPNSGTVYATLLCPEGYYCKAGTSSIEESNICPAGTYCPKGSFETRTCPGGSYQDSAGSGSCIPCPAGYECPAGSTAYKNKCPRNKYCPEGTETGIICQNGTYGNATRQTSQSDCTSCPGGKYCNQGYILGNCSSGYFCKSGQSSPAPYVNTALFTDTVALLHYLQSLDGGPCYPGYYCPKGTTDPISCSNGTVRINAYGESQHDCGACPLGYLCSVGNPVPVKCQVGHYCPLRSIQIACPVGTYNPVVAQFSLDNCTSCPAGFFCNSTGLSSYHNLPCPPGHFCVTRASTAFPCAGGTYRDSIGGISQTDCKRCPEGHYCGNGSSFYSTCEAGTYCPGGSVTPIICPPGSYCPGNASTPIYCPATYYCPLGAHRPRPCFLGTYCPAGTVYPIPCPLGYKAVDNTNHTHYVLASFQTACSICPPGFYGTDPNRLNCSLGTAGYYFTGGATSDKPTNLTSENGAICPKGSYCPEGSAAPIHCPPGSYQPYLGASAASACILCEANTYQSGNGSESCFKCSSSSVSAPGSTVCSCIGQNRIFQPSDGWCICKPSFEFVDSNLQVSSTNDGPFDCQPIVYSRCVAPLIRKQDGSCGTSSDCRAVCDKNGGTLSPSTGVCLCNNVTSLNQICDANCRNNAVNVTCTSDGNLNVYDPVAKTSKILSASEVSALGAGSISCATGAAVYSMTVSADGFAGVFGLGHALSSLSNNRRLLSSRFETLNGSYNALANWGYPHYGSSALLANSTNILALPDRLNSRFLAAAGNSSSPSLKNPIVVISVQDSIVFDLGGGYYPQYVKDSLLNTNPNFDYSAFRNLDSSSSTVSTFSFTFTEAGNYVFQLSSDSTSIVIISVLAQFVARSTSAQFIEMTNGNLVTVGVKTTSSIVLQPDWNLVIGLLLGMLALVLIVVGGLYYFRKKAWSHHTNIDSKYRKKNKAIAENTLKGTTAAPNSQSKTANNKVYVENESVAEPPPIVQDLESAAFANDDNEQTEFDDEMLLPDLAKHMQTHHDEIDRQLVTQNDLLASLQTVLKKEVEELKALLSATAANMSAAGSAGNKSHTLESILLQLKSDALMRALFEDDMSLTDKRMNAFLDRTVRVLRPDAEKVASNIVHEMAEQAIDLSDRDEAIVAINSPSLHEITEDLLGLKAFVDSTMLDGILNERRRKQAAEDGFDLAIRSTPQLIFPLSVSEKMKLCKDSELDLDVIHEEVISCIRIFCDRVPQFCTAMEEVESSLCKGLARTVNTGNLSLVEREQEIASQALETYLNDLLSAVNILFSSLAEKQPTVSADTEKCRDSRTLLIAAIDAILNPSTAVSPDVHLAVDRADNNTQQILDSILAALKEQRFVEKGASAEHKVGQKKRKKVRKNRKQTEDESSDVDSEKDVRADASGDDFEEDADSEHSEDENADEISDDGIDEEDGESERAKEILLEKSIDVPKEISVSQKQKDSSTHSKEAKSVRQKDIQSEPASLSTRQADEGVSKFVSPRQKFTEETAATVESVSEYEDLAPKTLRFPAPNTENEGEQSVLSARTSTSSALKKNLDPITSARDSTSSIPQSSLTAELPLSGRNSITSVSSNVVDPSLSAGVTTSSVLQTNSNVDPQGSARNIASSVSVSKVVADPPLYVQTPTPSVLTVQNSNPSQYEQSTRVAIPRLDPVAVSTLSDFQLNRSSPPLLSEQSKSEPVSVNSAEDFQLSRSLSVNRVNNTDPAAMKTITDVKFIKSSDSKSTGNTDEKDFDDRHISFATEPLQSPTKQRISNSKGGVTFHNDLDSELNGDTRRSYDEESIESPLPSSKSPFKRQGTSDSLLSRPKTTSSLDSRLSTPRLFTEPEVYAFDQKVIETVLNNESLTNVQKEDLLDAAQADMKIMDRILDLERKRQELIMQQAFESKEEAASNESSADHSTAADEEEQKKRFEEEKLLLEKSLEEARAKKLDELMQSADSEETEAEDEIEGTTGSGKDIADGFPEDQGSLADSIDVSQKISSVAVAAELEASKPSDEKKLQAFHESRIAALHRYWAYDAKIRYKELVLRYNAQRMKIQISKYDSDKAGESNTTNSLHVQDCEDQLNALDHAQGAELIDLQTKLQTSLEDALRVEEEKRESQKNSTVKVDFAAETASFVKEYKKKFMSFSGKLKKLSDFLKETNKLSRELKLAMFKSRSFTLEQKDFKSVLDNSKSELEQNNLLVEKIQEEDLRVLFAEESLLLQILEHPIERLSSRDELEAQSHLHLRILGVMNAHSTILPRLSMLENELLYEAKAIRLSTKMLRQKASKETIEEALVVLFEEKKSETVEILTSLQEKFMLSKSAEKKRQGELTSPNFESERARAIAEHARRDAQTALDVSKSQRKIQAALSYALDEKKTVLVENAKNTSFSSEEIRLLVLQQVDAELMRDELEMKVAFDSFEVGFTLVERYSAEILQGVQPSTDFIGQLVKVSNASELHFTQQAIHLDDSRKRFKKKLAAAMFTDFERKRLLSLGRISNTQDAKDVDHELANFLQEIKQRTDEEMRLIDVATSAELWRIENLFAKQLEQNVQIHETFAAEVENLVRVHEKEKESLQQNFERQKDYALSSTSRKHSEEDRERSISELEQTFVAEANKVDLKFQDALYSAFKKVMGKVLSQVQVEMELSNLQNRLRQESEAVESVVGAAKQDELQDLIGKQAARRTELKKSQEELEHQLQVEAKRAEEKFKKELKDIEETKQAREEALVEELKSSGVSDSEAHAAAAAELQKQDQERAIIAEQAFKQVTKETEAILSRNAVELKKKLDEIVLREDDESKELKSELYASDRQTGNGGGEAVSDIVKAASEASKEIQEKAKEELADIREKFTLESEKLKEEFQHLADKERSILRKRLDSRHSKRVKEMTEQQSKTGAEAEALLQKENEKLQKELEDQLQFKLEQSLIKKAREAAEVAKQVLETEHKKASLEASQANAEKEEALRKMALMKKAHLDDMRELEAALLAKRRETEIDLKKALLEKKAHLLKEHADEERRLDIEEKLAREELESLNKLLKDHSAEEAAVKEQKRREMERNAAAVVEELQKAELAAAKAAAKEGAIRGLKEAQKDSEEELNIKEVQRMRKLHKLQEERESEAAQQLHSKQSTKLHEKLDRKRLRKEQELKQQEQREIQQLLEKQQREKEEKEKLRLAKMTWSDKVKEVMKAAEEMGLSLIETEDRCYRETLSKKLVPETQLNEAVQMIQRRRHDEEMAKLLQRNFQERITKLTSAVERVIEDKNKSRIDLIERLMKEGTYDAKIESESAKLDAEYHERQMAVERETSSTLEDMHMKSQMQLRQRQLVEIAEVVSLYTDKETLAQLHSSTGKTQEEELLEYKRRIEVEKQQREEALAKEREETEKKLRQKLQDEVDKMQVQLQEEQSKAEAEFQRKRNLVLKHREEFEKKKAEEIEQLDNLEKERILSNFEKEHAAALDMLDQDRRTKKAKLADRLSKRRSSQATGPVSEEVKQQNPLPAISETPMDKPKEKEKEKDKEQNPSHSHHPQPHRGSKGSIGEDLSAAQATAAAAQLAAAQASSAAAAAAVLQSSIKQIEGKLERIEKVMSALEKNTTVPAPVPAPAPIVPPIQPVAPVAPAPLPVYQDRDEPAAGESLELIPDGDVTIQDRARIEFGKKIAAMIGVKNLTIKPAASLPPSALTDNAFSNSYRFSARDNTLLVHTNRLQSVGDFALILIHALSHIKVNPEDLSNDLDPKFTSEFYRNMKILSLDLYKKTAALNTQGGGGGGGLAAGAGPAGAASSFSLGNSKSKGALSLAAMRGRKLQQINTDFPAIADGNKGVDLAALALESPSGAGTKSEFMTSLTHPQEYFSTESLMERMKMYTQHGNIPADYLEKYVSSYQPNAASNSATKSTHSDS